MSLGGFPAHFARHPQKFPAKNEIPHFVARPNLQGVASLVVTCISEPLTIALAALLKLLLVKLRR